jgi:hypothetical protein
MKRIKVFEFKLGVHEKREIINQRKSEIGFEIRSDQT